MSVLGAKSTFLAPDFIFFLVIAYLLVTVFGKGLNSKAVGISFLRMTIFLVGFVTAAFEVLDLPCLVFFAVIVHAYEGVIDFGPVSTEVVYCLWRPL